MRLRSATTLGATVIRSLVLVATIALVAASFPAAAQESALPVDRNSQEVRDAQKQCTAELKQKLFKEKVKKTIFGAEEEAFQRCKKITGWQSPQ
jgi:hypothetical protein